jgi:hypothetical protein
MNRLGWIALAWCSIAWSAFGWRVQGAEPFRIATFDVDATPPVGSPLPYSATNSVVESLRCRGVVLWSDEKPIVLCAVDWLGIGNEGNRVFRERLASAAKTTADRVAVHTLHQHDAPWCDFSADLLAREHGAHGIVFDSKVSEQVLDRAVDAIRLAIQNPTTITHIGLGSAVVERVASNRRVLGSDGRVASVRWTATKDPAVRAAPEGVIDPYVRSVSFWGDGKRVAGLTYYATHPQSYYGKGDVNPDFPGLARNVIQTESTGLQIHFCGAAGNVGAGKYNDGSPENRPVLVQKLADGMRRALHSETQHAIDGSQVHWTTRDVLLPPNEGLQTAVLEALLADPARSIKEKIYAATQLIWLRRCVAGDPILVSCLRLGPARILHLPGELFVEYQLAAAEMLPGEFVAMAAYGDYAPCYIGTAVAYEQGGYETEPRSSLVSSRVEGVLIQAIQDVLGIERRRWKPLGVEAAEREVEFARAKDAAASPK